MSMPNFFEIGKDLVKELNWKLRKRYRESPFSIASDGTHSGIIVGDGFLLVSDVKDFFVYDDDPEFEKAGDYKTQVKKRMAESLSYLRDVSAFSIESLKEE